jgi:hypothetical protein
MASQDRYGAAIHEAGHVVVAWALGLKTRKLAVGIDGDDAAGAAEIEENSHLPTVRSDRNLFGRRPRTTHVQCADT